MPVCRKPRAICPRCPPPCKNRIACMGYRVLLGGIVGVYRAHKTGKALTGLSYAQLSDIGLERDDIRTAALRAAHM